MNNKIALTLISKGQGEEKKLEQALKSIATSVDAIFITFTSQAEQCQDAVTVVKNFEDPQCPIHISYGNFQWEATQEAVDWLTKFLGYAPHMKVGDKLFEFDRARNFNLSQVPQDTYPWFIWIDTDDIFRYGENLRKVCTLATQQNIEAVYFNYIYQAEFDERGNIKHRIIEHLRERLVRNNGAFKWIAPIHETIIEQRPTAKTTSEECDVVHMSTTADKFDSLTRNLKNLELAIYRTKGEDPRHTYYLAKAYFDEASHINKPELYDKAIPLLTEYISGEHKSGWPEERQQAWEYLSEIYRKKGDQKEALQMCINALQEPCEPSPSIYVNFALCWVMLQNWPLAMYWVKLATMMPDQQTTLIRNVKDIQGRVLEIIYNAQLNMRKVDEAWAAAKKMKEMYPLERTVDNALQFISQLRLQRDLVVKVADIVNHLKQSGEVVKIKPLLAAIPSLIEQTPYVQDLYMKNNPPKFWKANEIAIFCGPGFTLWSPKQLINPGSSFIGGSEEAAIEIANSLTKQGWKVTVYGNPGDDEGIIDGVSWLPYWKFNTLDNFNILLVWRQLGVFDAPIKAKKAYLWLHDVPNKLEYNKDRLEKIHKIIVLSKWHRECLDTVPDDKIMISSNGI